MSDDPRPDCPLCEPAAGPVLWHDDRCQVILAGDADYPRFCRVIWSRHVREMTDLPMADRQLCMNVVYAVERALRELLVPDKVNLASLGNQVPHLHWHVIPRFADDAHFPDPVWAPRRRPGRPRDCSADALRQRLVELLGPCP